jgi:hypothetical protein
MSRDEQLKLRWENVITILSEKFAGGEDLDFGWHYLLNWHSRIRKNSRNRSKKTRKSI